MNIIKLILYKIRAELCLGARVLIAIFAISIVPVTAAAQHDAGQHSEPRQQHTNTTAKKKTKPRQKQRPEMRSAPTAQKGNSASMPHSQHRHDTTPSAVPEPDALDTIYGRNPTGAKVFIRLRPGRMEMNGHAGHGGGSSSHSDNQPPLW